MPERSENTRIRIPEWNGFNLYVFDSNDDDPDPRSLRVHFFFQWRQSVHFGCVQLQFECEGRDDPVFWYWTMWWLSS
jgi:hypothetical protein